MTIYRNGEQIGKMVFVQSGEHVRKENRDEINEIDDEVNVVLRDHLMINQAIEEAL
jgi:hypothetical protein